MDNLSRQNSGRMGGREKKIFEEIMIKIFPNLLKLQTHRPKNPSTRNMKKVTQMHIIIKLLKPSDKEENRHKSKGRKTRMADDIRNKVSEKTGDHHL